MKPHDAVKLVRLQAQAQGYAAQVRGIEAAAQQLTNQVADAIADAYEHAQAPGWDRSRGVSSAAAFAAFLRGELADDTLTREKRVAYTLALQQADAAVALSEQAAALLDTAAAPRQALHEVQPLVQACKAWLQSTEA